MQQRFEVLARFGVNKTFQVRLSGEIFVVRERLCFLSSFSFFRQVSPFQLVISSLAISPGILESALPSLTQTQRIWLGLFGSGSKWSDSFFLISIRDSLEGCLFWFGLFSEKVVTCRKNKKSSFSFFEIIFFGHEKRFIGRTLIFQFFQETFSIFFFFLMLLKIKFEPWIDLVESKENPLKKKKNPFPENSHFRI